MSQNRTTNTFDYVIVGAGSAGCVLANRLSADKRSSVILLEAGGDDSSLFIDIPAGVLEAMHRPQFNWNYTGEPESQLHGRTIPTPQGKVLGGSSSINAMMYMRGNPLDYENWVRLGAHGWSYAEALPYFKRAESYDQGEDRYRGASGPLRTTRPSMHNPLFRTFIEAGVEAGYPFSADLNGFQQEGFGAADMTIAGGRRASTARAFLRPVMGRPNLAVETAAQVSAVRVSGRRTSGVTYLRDGNRHFINARREVILAAGAANSPKLLMLSGIGPGKHLQDIGIALHHDLPGVGANLMDHPCVYLLYECLAPVSIQPTLRRYGRLMAGLRWFMSKSGPAASNQFEASAFIRSHAGVRWPNIQLDFMPMAMLEDLSVAPVGHGFGVHAMHLRPKSRGTVRLHSIDAMKAPLIHFNYLSNEQDWRDIRTIVQLTQEILHQPAFDGYRGRALLPKSPLVTDSDLDDFIRDSYGPGYHLSGTCKMGTDVESVVDPACRVHGMDNLRVVDASVMPQITSGNLNAPVVMLAEKASDLILDIEPAQPTAVDYYVSPQWETKQRAHAAQRAF